MTLKQCLIYILMFLTLPNIAIAEEKLFIVKENSVIDVKSGLEWYKLNKTTNMSYLDLRADYNSPGNMFDKSEGWRHATKSEFGSLVTRWFKFEPRFEFSHRPVPKGKAELTEKFINSFGDTGANLLGHNTEYDKLTGKASSAGFLIYKYGYNGANKISVAAVSDNQWQNKKGIAKDKDDLVTLKLPSNKLFGHYTTQVKSKVHGHWIVKRVTKSTLETPTIKATTIPFPTMVLLPEGTYNIGCSKEDKSCLPFEKPNVLVFISSFFIATTEVTFEQYDFYCDKAPTCKKPADEGWGRGNRPVINVSYQDAKKYIKWLNAQTKRKFRLPTEAEWEYAARAGTETIYYWGNEADGKYANGAQKKVFNVLGVPWDKNWQEWPEDGYMHTAPVASFSPNKWGLYDMVGNVHEWCEDKWHSTLKNISRTGQHWRRGNLQVLRGGAWDGPAFYIRLSMRGNSPANTKSRSAGIRLVID